MPDEPAEFLRRYVTESMSDAAVGQASETAGVSDSAQPQEPRSLEERTLWDPAKAAETAAAAAARYRQAAEARAEADRKHFDALVQEAKELEAVRDSRFDATILAVSPSAGRSMNFASNAAHYVVSKRVNARGVVTHVRTACGRSMSKPTTIDRRLGNGQLMRSNCKACLGPLGRLG